MKSKISLIAIPAVLFFSKNSNAQIIGTGTYIPGNYVGVGILNSGGFEGAPSAGAPAACHPRSATGFFGFTANPLMDGWVDFNGDFFTPGTPENGWGIELGGTSGVKASNNRHNDVTFSGPRVDIPGSVTNWEYVAGCYVADWAGDFVGGGHNVHVDITYQLKEDDLYYSTTVRITNNGTAAIPQVYYYRNVDPDNNVSLSGSYQTNNTIVAQPTATCSKAIVTAEQGAGPGWSSSYMGFAAMGDDYRVCYGGFSNRDASDMWNGIGFTSAVGSASFSTDIAISLSHRTLNLDPGETTTIKFLVILDEAQLDEALNSYMSFEYIGALADPPSCLVNVDSAISCSGNPLTIEFNGSIEDDYTWTWSPATGLDTTGGNIVQAFPTDTMLYTITGVPLNPCFVSNIVSQIVVIPAQGPEIVMDDPGIHCIDYDLNDLVFSDQNGLPGTVSYFLDEAPTNAIDTSFFPGTIAHPGDSVYLFISEPTLGCYDYELIPIEWSPGFTYDAELVNPICMASNGSIEIVDVTGAVGTVDYQWAGGPTSALYGSIPAGTYSVHMEDEAGCVEDTVFNFPNVTTMTSSIAVDAFAECSTPSGAITVTPISGVFPYNYDIGAGPVSSGVFTGLNPGLHVVEITDNAGCLIFDSIVVPDTSTLNISLVSALDVDCGSSDGEITVAGSGGLTPYTYTLLTDTQTSAVFDSLSSGTYTIYVNGGGGCKDSIDVTIVDNMTMTATLVDTTSAICGSGGAVEVTAADGGFTYSYTLSGGGPTQPTGVFTNLNPGSYTITVTSGTCVQNVPFTIVSNQTLTAVLVDTTSIHCDPGGAVEVTAANGSASGIYNFTVPSYGTQTNGIFTGLPAGTYNMTVTSGTCNVTVPFTIAAFPTLVATLVNTGDAHCVNPNGTVVVTAANGSTSGIYTFTVPGHGTQNNGNFSGLPGGPYIMSVTSGTCSVAVPFTIGVDPGDLSLALQNAYPEDCGTLNGLINAQATGGTTPYDFSIDGGATVATPSFNALDDGLHIVRVEDVNGCVDTLHVMLGEIPLDIDLGNDIITCNSHLLSGDGTPGTYVWSTTETGQSITVTENGDYWLMVSRPEVGCFDIDTVHIELIENPIITPANIFTPNNDGVNDEFVIHGMFVTTYHIAIFNRWGQEVFSSDNINESWDGKAKNGNPADEGVYMYIIEYDNPCENPSLQKRNGSLQLAR